MGPDKKPRLNALCLRYSEIRRELVINEHFHRYKRTCSLGLQCPLIQIKLRLADLMLHNFGQVLDRMARVEHALWNLENPLHDGINVRPESLSEAMAARISDI